MCTTTVQQSCSSQDEVKGAVSRRASAAANGKQLDTQKGGRDGGENAQSSGQAAQERLTMGEQLRDGATHVFLAVHLLAIATPFIYGVSWRDVLLVLITYNLRMFGITGGYHRLLSHRSYQTSRPVQFLITWLGTASLQKGPLWWASHHRHHHRHADTEEDAHSPTHHGFFWSHVGWFMCTNQHHKVLWGSIPDLASVPELVWLEKNFVVPPAALALGLWAFSGVRAMMYGFMVSTVLCWHCTYAINSIAHVYGSRKLDCEFNTPCTARNNLLLALVTLGEGWHNNHHASMISVKHGFKQPWQIDVTYYVIKALESVGLAWNLKLAPKELMAAALD